MIIVVAMLAVVMLVMDILTADVLAMIVKMIICASNSIATVSLRCSGSTGGINSGPRRCSLWPSLAHSACGCAPSSLAYQCDANCTKISLSARRKLSSTSTKLEQSTSSRAVRRFSVSNVVGTCWGKASGWSVGSAEAKSHRNLSICGSAGFLVRLIAFCCAYCWIFWPS